MYFYVAIACVLGAAAAAPSGLGLEPIGLGVAVDSVSVPRYNFNYAVNDPSTGDHKSQHEVREGGVVKGSYSLTEPDGTLRVVDYTADPAAGFNAVVKRVGAAAHPQHIQWSKPAIVAAPVDLGWSHADASHGLDWSRGLDASHSLGWSHGLGASHDLTWSHGLDASHGLDWSHGLGLADGLSLGHGYGGDLGLWKH